MNNEPTFTVIIPTIGRDMLRATLESCGQLTGRDEIIMVFDGPGEKEMSDLASWSCLSDLHIPYTFAFQKPAMGDWGHPIRNRYAHLASRSHILSIDDDDVFAPGAIAKVRERVSFYPDALNVFAMRLSESVMIPNRSEMVRGNIGTPCGVVPNVPEKWGRWRMYEGDYEFYAGCKFPVQWHLDTVIAEIRPHTWKKSANV